MLFVFDQTADWDFWMKNTLTSLDMVWVEADGTVTNVASNVPASTLTTPDAKIARRHGHGKYVVELPPGEASMDGIAPGLKIEICSLMHFFAEFCSEKGWGGATYSVGASPTPR